MPQVSLASPSDQRVTFVELFFDLVFVFCVTQVVSLLHDGVTWKAIGEVVLVFWMVWWGWTQFTWALNAGDTTHPRVEFATLVATGVAFFLGVGIPSAFHGYPLWFAAAYVALRGIGLLIYDWVAWTDPAQRAAVRYFAAFSVGGLVAVLIGGFLGGTLQYVFWGLAIALDLVAAGVAARAEGWNINPEHFVERHGLIVIIALGESLIVAALSLTKGPWPAGEVIAVVLSVAIAGAMWWTYFTRSKPELDHGLEHVAGNARSTMARDAFSFIHFVVVMGIIAFAATVEHALAHATDPLGLSGRALLAFSVLAFVGGTGLALRRARRPVSQARRWIPLLTAALVMALATVPALVSLGVVLVGVTLVALFEPISRDHRASASACLGEIGVRLRSDSFSTQIGV